MKKTFVMMAGLALAFGGAAAAEEVKDIQDNSFLVEEAYNQEPGVIQHIQSYQYLKRSKTWAYSFTEEWPVPRETHQLSFTVPVSHFGDSSQKTDIGDIALNYRYQLVMKGPVALAPRLSLLLPTGDYKTGFGSGALGGQTNIPLSLELSKMFVTHWNAGATFVPGSRAPDGARADTLGYNAGASVIFLAAKTFNLMCEAAWSSFELVQEGGGKARDESFFINPGLRAAINFKSGLQIVPGVSFPIGVGRSRGERGVLAYLSFEHPLW